MADVAGRDLTLQVSTNGSSYTAVGGLTSATVSSDGSVIDVTDNDSNGHSEHLVGPNTKTGSFTFNYDEADTGQDILRTSNESLTIIYYRIQPRGAVSTSRRWTCQGSITSFDDVSSSTDGKAEFSMDVQFTGAPTIDTVP